MTEGDTLKRLIDVTERFVAGRPGNFPLHSHSSISQDAYIFGIDAYDYFGELEADFGPVVREIPWMEWTDQTESYYGCAAGCFPLVLLTRLFAWPFTVIAMPNRPSLGDSPSDSIPAVPTQLGRTEET